MVTSAQGPGSSAQELLLYDPRRGSLGPGHWALGPGHWALPSYCTVIVPFIPIAMWGMQKIS